MGHMVEDSFGTLAVALAVMQMMQQRDASFEIKNVPLGIDMTWKGSLPYFKFQQTSMLVLAKTDPEESADLGMELLQSTTPKR
ncbi:hypothetical protein QQZ08_000439 [Neonectria magnoliae]|uniref:Uncharacterized protein n=1 Tax=Neonectria magnoliae TaxID=2732573 RepID=A0ABR1IHA9_9HYPO